MTSKHQGPSTGGQGDTGLVNIRTRYAKITIGEEEWCEKEVTYDDERPTRILYVLEVP